MRKLIPIALLLVALGVSFAHAETLKIGECADCDSSIVPDTRLSEGNHLNGGAVLITGTGWFGANEFRSIYRFPLDQEELTGATITAATFGCNVFGVGGAGGNTTIEIHKIAEVNQGWIEGTKNNTTAGAGEPDWFHFSHTSPVTTWAVGDGLTGSGDYAPPVYGSFNGTSTGAKTATLSAAAIVDLNSNIGTAVEYLLFTSDAFNNDENTNIYSSEWTTASERPFLELTYTPAGGAGQVMMIWR